MPEGQDHLQSDEDVEEILRMAVRTEGTPGQSLRERLNVSASELGISPETLARAEQQWIAKRQGVQDAEVEREERRQFRRIRIGDFVGHLATYVAVNGFLLWLDLRGDGVINWAFWPIAGWGIAIFIHAVTSLVPGADEERDFRRWQKKRRRGQA
jgi:hypothetical protein